MVDEHDDRRAKDLYKAGELRVPPAAGIKTTKRLLRRFFRRPAGNTRRLWLRVAGEDPFFRMTAPPDIKRKTVYADGRFVRLEDGKVPKRGSGPKRVKPPPRDNSPSTSSSSKPSGNDLIPPGFRNIPAASASSSPPQNQGASLIPPGFRDIPTAKSQRQAPASNPTPGDRGENLGEALIPKGFLDIPLAKPKPPPRPPKPDVMPKAPPLPPREQQNTTGRIRQPRRSRQVIRTPKSEPRPTPPAPPPKAADRPQAPPPERPKVEPAPKPQPAARSEPPVPIPPPPKAAPKPEVKPGPPPSAGGLDDLFAAPTEGRKRLGRRRRPTPSVVEKKKDGE